MALSSVQQFFVSARRKLDAWFVRFNNDGTSYTSTNVQDALVEALTLAGGVDDAIADGVTDRAPSQNAVFDALALKVPTSYLDTDVALAANSDSKVATQKATKAYVDAHGADILEVQVFS